MRISKENEQGKLLFWIDVDLQKLDLSEYSGEDGDWGEEWSYKVGEVPKEIVEEVTNLSEKLNLEGEPISKENAEKVINEAMDMVVTSNKANSYFLN